ncbi:MAG TPA: ZIP family metal transporter [Flavobacteriaceae bacterium]|nr:ZIP family metal transporter [Flavobacteriaceae bacterium]
MSILLPIIAVILGFVIALFLKANSNAVKLLLSFSGAFLLSITVFEFLPQVYRENSETVGIFIMLGLLLQIVLEFLSKGAEHGHLHPLENQNQFPWALFFGLCVHALLEGFPLHHNHHLLFGVVVHKIPIAVIISAFLLGSSLSKTKVVFFLCVFALMTPLGSFLQAHTSFFEGMEVYINAMIIGIFLHVSTTILFESSKNHQFNASKMIVIVLGILLAYFL